MSIKLLINHLKFSTISLHLFTFCLTAISCISNHVKSPLPFISFIFNKSYLTSQRFFVSNAARKSFLWKYIIYLQMSDEVLSDHKNKGNRNMNLSRRHRISESILFIIFPKGKWHFRISWFLDGKQFLFFIFYIERNILNV